MRHARAAFNGKRCATSRTTQAAERRELERKGHKIAKTKAKRQMSKDGMPGSDNRPPKTDVGKGWGPQERSYEAEDPKKRRVRGRNTGQATRMHRE